MCMAESLGYDEPFVNITREGVSIASAYGLSFATVGNFTTPGSTSLTCNISNFVSSESFEMEVSVVGESAVYIMLYMIKSGHLLCRSLQWR